MNAPVTELTLRAREVFRAVVEAYLETGQPVGSKLLADRGRLNLSPASIRGVMHELEEAGLLAHPHTSAGRMPTEGGLRLFVDAVMQAAEPSAEERAVIEARLQDKGPVEEALAAATAALSGLSACAGLVLVPQREARLREAALVPLSDARALAVLVAEDGQIENRVIDLPPGLDGDALGRAGAYLSRRVAGTTLTEAQRRIAAELRDGEAALDAAARTLVEAGLALWGRDGGDRPVLIVRGAANLIDGAALADVERVRQLLDEIEAKEQIAGLLGSAREAEATKVFIGAETRLFALSASSVIAAPYRGRDGRVVGVVGVIGPTRLNYARIVPMVDFTAQSLTRWVG